MTDAEQILNKLLARYPQLASCEEQILQAGDALISCFRSGGKLLVCGNGGSASDAEHIVGELMKGFRLRRSLTEPQRKSLEELFPGEKLADCLQGALPAIALSAHTALGTAYSNDVSADMVFAQQVWGYGRPEDLLLALSTSGNSQNVVNAAKVAKAVNVPCIGIGGGSGGVLRELCSIFILLPEAETYLVQELTLPVYHALCQIAESAFWSK